MKQGRAGLGNWDLWELECGRNLLVLKPTLEEDGICTHIWETVHFYGM